MAIDPPLEWRSKSRVRWPAEIMGAIHGIDDCLDFRCFYFRFLFFSFPREGRECALKLTVSTTKSPECSILIVDFFFLS